MWIGISALLARAMQLDARQLRTHLFRLAFVSFIYFSLLYAQLEAMSRGAPGLYFLKGIIFLNALFITLAGVSFFSSAITEEKEENTLGLLQMAGIGPMSVLLGKSTSRLIQALMLLLVQFPFTLLSITLGGVTMQQVFAAYAALLAYLIGLANLALLWSVVCRRTGSAAGLTTLILVLYFIGPFVAQQLLSLATSIGWSTTRGWEALAMNTLIVISNSEIFRRLMVITATGFNEPMISTQVITNFLFGVACFGLARLIFLPCTRDVGQQTETRGLVLTSSSRMKLFSSGRCWGNPFVWKDFHFLTGGYSLAIVKFFAYAALFGAIALFAYYESMPRQIEWPAVFQMFAASMIGFLVLEASISAARIFHDEIRMHTMSALLMLPRSIPYLGYSKTIGCLLGLIPAASWLIISAVIMVSGGMIHGPVYQPFGGQYGMLLDFIVDPNLWASLLVVSFFLHLTALLSLFVKWGALPLAIGVMAMMTCVCPIVPIMFTLVQGAAQIQGGAQFAATITLILINIVSSFVLQMMIGARLQEIGST